MHMNKQMIALVLAMLLTGCATGAATAIKRPQTRIDKPAPAAAFGSPYDKRGLEAVMGKDSASLIRLFGAPRLDVVEVVGRKLQFTGKACVLDAYLYPDGKNGAEIVTHIDARRSDGAEVDRAACVDALIRR
jgi:hypothetical protein